MPTEIKLRKLSESKFLTAILHRGLRNYFFPVIYFPYSIWTFLFQFKKLHFSFLKSRVVWRKICVLIPKTGHPKKMSYVNLQVEIFLKSRVHCMYCIYFYFFWNYFRYIRTNSALKNYAHIFAIMMRLRQLSCHRDLLPIQWNDVNMNDLKSLIDEIHQGRSFKK